MKQKKIKSSARTVSLIGISFFMAISSTSADEKSQIAIKAVNPSTLYDGSAFGMSQAKVDIDTGLVFVSGQVDWGLDYKVKHESVEEQTKTVMENLKTVLEEANSSIEQVLQIRVYVRGELADNMDKIVPILASYLSETRPALTGVGVASLASPDTLIEIEAVAKILK